MQFSIEDVIEDIIVHILGSAIMRLARFIYKRVDWSIFVSFPFFVWLAMHWYYVIFVLHPPLLNSLVSPTAILLAPLIVVCEVAFFYLVVIADI